MDNLALMGRIQDNTIDLICCDILYNTGRNFGEFKDSLGTPQQAVEWYHPRVVEMQRVLSLTELFIYRWIIDFPITCNSDG